jgi:aldose 1-epimerase
MEVSVLDYGALVHSIKVPDRNVRFEEITFGYDTIEQYQSLNQFFGAFIGRFANRIKNGSFFLDGKKINISANMDTDHLHGGYSGFDQKCWQGEISKRDGRQILCMELISEDGSEGFPGRLETKLTYELTQDNALVLSYNATTDKTTIVNLASHIYFNLTGNPDNDILGHELKINAAHIAAVDKKCIPTGEILSVEGTPFDFTSFYSIGERIDSDDRQLEYGGGYDHNYVLDKNGEDDLQLAASVIEPSSGRRMDVLTTQPGLQFYSGNNLAPCQGKGGKLIRYRHAFCLEAQHFPDSPNHGHFPSTRLESGQTYAHCLVLKFSTME